MSIGAGIAVAGVWVFCGMAALSPTVTGIGLSISIIVAGIATAVLLGH